MEQNITPEQKEFIEKTKKHRAEKSEEIALRMLAFCLKEDLPYRDVHYIAAKAKELLTQAMTKINFDNPDIAKAREAFLKSLVFTVKKNLPKHKPKKLDRTETDDRDDRCNLSVREFLNHLLDEGLIFSDRNYIEKGLADDNRYFLYAVISGYMDSVYDFLITTLSFHEKNAYKELWGVDSDDVTFSMLDRVLKNTKIDSKKK